jgi:predicted transcriptional regulator
MGAAKNITLEPELFERVTKEARREGRSPDDIANEATKRYLTGRRLQALQQYGQRRAEGLGLTEGDVSRLILDSRAEQRSR